MSEEDIIGIDLGTTNSCVAAREAGNVVVIPNAEGSRTTPSIMALTDVGEQLVGHVAKRQAVANPVNTVFAIKRLMGRKHDSDECTRQREMCPYEIIPAENGDAWVEVKEKKMSPPEVSAIVLAEMRSVAEAYIGSEVTRAVITVRGARGTSANVKIEPSEDWKEYRTELDVQPGYCQVSIHMQRGGEPDQVLWVDDMEFGYMAK